MRSSPNLPSTFSQALRFLRKRARLTQDELGRAVGYSREQIARLENGSRLPDLAVIAALFVPALLLEREQLLVEQFLALAGATRRDRQITVTHTKATQIQVVQETVAVPPPTALVPPAPLLPLLGRHTEVADLLACLQTARLITVVGAPGIGKTRLALEVAHAALPAFADGAAFISLSEVTTSADIPYVVLQQLEITPAPQQTPTAAILAYLKPRRLLLVLDNCEHVLEGTPLFADWLAHAPHLKLLCTSRVPLDLYGEQEWPLAPLVAPDLAAPPHLGWGESPALQLLLARAQAIDPTFTLTEENLLPLATLCVALDGLPLALELVAVRLREASPAQLAQELLTLRGNGQLASTWLRQSRRNVADRHRTLHAAIRWSVDMLTPAQQAAFAHLGLFVGGGAFAAAFAVAQADATLLAQLARANLIQMERERFHLLETLRTFALEQLTDAGRLSAGQQVHAHYYAQCAQQIFAGLIGDEQALWMQRAIADHDNCLAALRWALAQAEGETAVAIAGGLWWFWYRRGLFTLAQEMLTAALQLPSADLNIRANALNGLASVLLVNEAYAAALDRHAEGLTLRRQLNDAAGMATVLHNMGLAALTMGDFAQAMTWLAESVAADPDSDPTSAWAHMGLIAQETQDMTQARHWLEQAYHNVAAAPDGWLSAFVMNYLADVLRELGELEAALTLAQRSLQIFTALDDSYYLPDVQLTLAQIALAQGDLAQAETLAQVVRDCYAARDDAAPLASVRLFQAELALQRGAQSEAYTHYQEAQTLRQTARRAMSPREQACFEALATRLAEQASQHETRKPPSAHSVPNHTGDVFDLLGRQ